MTPGERPRISFGTPDIDELERDGFLSADMHVHTRHSDAAPSARQVLDRARRRRIGVAITDHNEIAGVREVRSSRPDVPVIPGIELDCAEGPHLLLYFYSFSDLVDFYDRHVRERRRGAQYVTSYPAIEQLLSAAEGYSCLKIAAHPFGYFGLDRGVLKCDAKGLLPGVIGRLDGVEAICGGMTGAVNRRAAEYADAHTLPVTGGSDAHVLREVGRVVTAVGADSVGEFLDGIARGESIVAGSSSGILSRGMAAGVIGCNYVPYSVTAVRARLECSLERLFRRR
ncbi:MAG: PHP domain-containing protein [Methanospirillum sp.]|nr:PHP domain-containing protein [Methanospirillum sp.]